ncbi:MAG: acyltransferase [Campylobacteraceae bacterium]|nr:acyltransferase [Campylobacteraceae bacterium]
MRPPHHHLHLSHPKYRPDIDGLRAIAVLSVVAFHAFPNWMRGGFIGVDIFFVISGFLISTIIFENLDKGTFSFFEFYARRIKRIFPALLLVLIACYVFGWFALLADEYKQLGKHIAAGAGFVSNFILWGEAGYFDNTAETKPLLHLWSLGIEEQFYIVWPLLLWFAWKQKFNLLTLTITVALVSFILNFKGVKHDLIATFYSPQTRFWELLCGSILSWVILYKKNAFLTLRLHIDSLLAKIIYRDKTENDGRTLSNILSFVGLALLTYGFWKIDKNFSFPGKWALLPVLGAVFIILAGAKAWINRKVLSNKIVVWFGLISFPLYLWHWPLLSFARIIESEMSNRTIRISVVLTSIILAWLTYRLIERPIRLGKYSNLKVFILVIFMVVLGIIGYKTYDSDGFKFRVAVKKTEANASMFTMPELKASREYCKNIISNDYNGHCLVSEGKNILSDFNLIFIGDSHSEALTMGYFNFEKSEIFLSLGRGGCLPFVGVERFTENGPINCESFYKPYFDNIINKSSSKSTLLISARYSAYVEGSGFGEIDNKDRAPGNLHIQKPGAKVEGSLTLYKNIFYEGLLDTLKLVSNKVQNVVIVLQVPELGFDPRSCIERPFANSKLNCYVLKKDVLNRQNNYRFIINEIAKFDFVIKKNAMQFVMEKCYTEMMIT